MIKVLIHLVGSIVCLVLLAPLAFHFTGNSPKLHDTISPDSVLAVGSRHMAAGSLAEELAPTFYSVDSLPEFKGSYYDLTLQEGKLYITYQYLFADKDTPLLGSERLRQVWEWIYLSKGAGHNAWLEVVVDLATGQVESARTRHHQLENWSATLKLTTLNGRNELKVLRAVQPNHTAQPPPAYLDDDTYQDYKFVRRDYATHGSTEREGNYALIFIEAVFIVYYFNFMISPYLWPTKAGTRAFRINNYFRNEPEPFETDHPGS